MHLYVYSTYASTFHMYIIIIIINAISIHVSIDTDIKPDTHFKQLSFKTFVIHTIDIFRSKSSTDILTINVLSVLLYQSGILGTMPI